MKPICAQSKDDAAQGKHDSAKPEGFKPERQASQGSVTVNGKTIAYDAFAGTIVVHPKGWDDVPQNTDKDDKNLPAEASMCYIAYIKSGEPNPQRPVTFLYTGGEFEKNLEGDTDTTTGRLDTRFSGPTLDPLSKEAEYDPQAAISSAYVSAFNDYVRKDLKFGENREYKPMIDAWKSWNFQHQPPGAPYPCRSRRT